MNKHPHTMREAGEPKNYGTRAERKSISRQKRRARDRAVVQEEVGDTLAVGIGGLGNARTHGEPIPGFDL